MAGPASSVVVSGLPRSTSLIPLQTKAGANSTVMASSGLQITPPSIEGYFSQSQMALALSIAKTCPEGISMREFCHLLLKHLAQNTSGDQRKILRHIDSCEFWKELYENIHQENKRLQGKVRLLEERQRIYERLPSPDSEGQRGVRSSRKRPADLDEVEEWLQDEGSDVILPTGDIHLYLSSYTLRISYKRHELERIIKDLDSPDHIGNVWTVSRDLLWLLEAALADCLIPLRTLKCDDETQTVSLFQQLMTQVVLGFFTSFEALNELASTIPGRKKRHEIVHGLVMFFEHALDNLHAAAGFQAERESIDKRGLCNKSTRTEQSEYVVNKYLSRALVQMTKLDWETGHLGHGEILEGILYSVIDHTGRLLSQTIFSEHVAASDKPGKISLRSPASQSAATKFEFRYIVHILHAALGGTAKRELVARVLGDRLPSKSTTEGQLLSSAKKRLQNTLVKSAVGADVEGLKLPELLEEVEVYSPGVSHHVEQYGSEWFLEAIWALVGWELAA